MRQIPRNRLFAAAAALFALAALPAAVLAIDNPGDASAPSGSAVGPDGSPGRAPASDGYSIDTSTPSGGAGSTTGVEKSTGSVNDLPPANDASTGNRAQSPIDHGDVNHAGNLQ